jgi:hypothetical protein
MLPGTGTGAPYIGAGSNARSAEEQNNTMNRMYDKSLVQQSASRFSRRSILLRTIEKSN